MTSPAATTSPAITPALSLHNATVSYGSRVALDNATLTIPQGHITALIGPNGAGKSTLLKTIMGLITPTSGQVTYHQGLSPARISYVPQHDNVNWDFPVSVRDVVTSGVYARAKNRWWGRLSQEQRRTVDEALRAVALLGSGAGGVSAGGTCSAERGVGQSTGAKNGAQSGRADGTGAQNGAHDDTTHKDQQKEKKLLTTLKDFLHLNKADDLSARHISELSGGQKKRVFVARGLAQGARLMLLDEPFAGVDQDTEAALIELFHDLRDQGMSLLIVSHNLEQLPLLADSVAMLNRTIIASGPVDTTLTRENLLHTFSRQPSTTPAQESTR